MEFADTLQEAVQNILVDVSTLNIKDYPQPPCVAEVCDGIRRTTYQEHVQRLFKTKQTADILEKFTVVSNIPVERVILSYQHHILRTVDLKFEPGLIYHIQFFSLPIFIASSAFEFEVAIDYADNRAGLCTIAMTEITLNEKARNKLLRDIRNK